MSSEQASNSNHLQYSKRKKKKEKKVNLLVQSLNLCWFTDSESLESERKPLSSNIYMVNISPSFSLKGPLAFNQDICTQEKNQMLLPLGDFWTLSIK